MHLRLEYYNESDLKEIIIRTAEVLGTGLMKKVPLNLLAVLEGLQKEQSTIPKRVRDFQQVNEDEQIYIETTSNDIRILFTD
ncbi:hypothetical protein ACVXZ0_04920 [Staphylococcus aureus]